jgi:hypothetical protein
VKISHDQSFVGFLEESGRLSEADAMNHPKRNEINKALGFEAHLAKNTDYIETGQSPFLSGDMLLLCSDGLTDMVGSAEITDILTKERPLKEKGKQLIEAANHHGGKDNVTVVLVHNNKTPQTHSATAVKQREQSSNTPTSRITEKPKRDEPGPAAKSHTGLIAVLTVLMLIFAGAAVYFYLKAQPESNAAVQPPPQAPIKIQPGALQVKLQKALDNLKGNVLILADTAYQTPIIISYAIQINKDTLLIKTKGNIAFQADSGYDGAAIKLATKCRIITIDSLSFHNFKTGIAVANNNLALNHVQFVNCAQGISNEAHFPDSKFISGKSAPLNVKTDSLPVSKK